MDLALFGITAILTAVSGQQDAPVLVGVQLFDSFGFETSVVYNDGYVLVSCASSGPICDETLVIDLIAPDDTNVTSSACNETSGMAHLHLRINDSTQLGEYSCRYQGGNKSSRSLTIPYRLCDDRSAACWANASRCGNNRNKVCVVSDTGPKECSTIDKTWCDDKHHRRDRWWFCPGNKTSWCEAIDMNEARVWMSGNNCPLPLERIPSTKMENPARQEIWYLYDQPFLVNTSAHKLTIVVASGDLRASKVICEVKDRNGTKILQESFNIAYVYELSSLSAVVNRSSQIFKLRCALESIINPDSKAWLSNILVVLGGEAVITETLAEDPQYTTSLECQVDPAPSKDINVSYAWFRNTTGLFSNEAIIDVNETDEYHCEANLSYITCSPYWQLGPYTTKSDSVMAVPPPPPTSPTSPPRSVPP